MYYISLYIVYLATGYNQTYIPLYLINSIVDDRVVTISPLHTIFIDGIECTICSSILLHMTIQYQWLQQCIGYVHVCA